MEFKVSFNYHFLELTFPLKKFSILHLALSMIMKRDLMTLLLLLQKNLSGFIICLSLRSFNFIYPLKLMVIVQTMIICWLLFQAF